MYEPLLKGIFKEINNCITIKMNERMNEPIYVAFSTQKGGAGKTTLTVLAASYLHYVKGYNVAVVDCDFPQYSIKDMRDRDMASATGDDHYKAMAYEQFKRLQKKADRKSVV